MTLLASSVVGVTSAANISVVASVPAYITARDAPFASALLDSSVGDVIAVVGVLWFPPVVIVSVVGVPVVVVVPTVFPSIFVSTSSGGMLLSAFPVFQISLVSVSILLLLLFFLLLRSQEFLWLLHPYHVHIPSTVI